MDTQTGSASKATALSGASLVIEAVFENLAVKREIFGVRPEGSVTAGNSSGINDGAAAVLVASEAAVRRHGLRVRARVVGSAVAGVAPRIMGIGPVPATRKLLARTGLELTDFDVIELNEAFAAQSLAVLRELELPDDAGETLRNRGPLGGPCCRRTSAPRRSRPGVC